MKKTLSVISLLLVLCLILPAMPITAEENAALEMGSFEEIISSYYDPDGRPMSCAHRAITYIGNPIPENSLAAIADSIAHKVDIVELDIMRTKDGVFVLCHDSSIKRTTTYTGSLNVSDMTYEEICQYPLLQYTGGSREVYRDENGNTLVMPTFEQALEVCKGKIMINLDKFTGQWAHRMELYEIVRKHGCLDLVMFKGGYDSGKILGWHKEIKAQYGTDAQMPNFCTLNSNRSTQSWINEIEAHYKAKTAFAVEAGFSDYTQPQSDPEAIARIKQYTRAFTNVLYESIGGTHSAKHKENSTGFAEVFSLGYNIIQTNNSAALAAYIYANYSSPTRDIGSGIDLLYFSNFKHYQLNYTIGINAPSVKLYNGDYISFKNVDFTGCDGKQIVVSLTGSSGVGELVLRKDTPEGEVIARFDLSAIGNQTINAIADMELAAPGICDVYVCAENTGDGYVSASRLICADPMSGEIVRISGLSFFTRSGEAPKLPEEVSIVNEFGFTYTAEVIWSPVPEECYAEDLTTFTVPGIIRSNCQTVYARVVVIDLDMTGAAVWFDSLGEMVLGESGEVVEWYDSINSICASADAQTAPKYKDGAVSFAGSGDNMVYDHSLSGKENVSLVINAKTDKKSTDYMSDYKINNSARYTLIHYPESASWGSVYFTAFKNGIVCRFGSGVSNNRGIYYTGSSVEGWSTVSAVKSGTSEKIYLGSGMVYDRSTDKSNAHQYGNPGKAIAATHDYAYIGFGIQSSAKYYYSGDVADIVVFERTLTDAEIATLDSYFKAKNQNTIKDKSSAVVAEFEGFLSANLEKIHDIEYTFTDSFHTVSCLKCDYIIIEDHSLDYFSKDDNSHVKTCRICGYECAEEHDYRESEAVYKCEYCNAEKPIPTQGGEAIVIVVISTIATIVTVALAAVLIYKKKRSK